MRYKISITIFMVIYFTNAFSNINKDSSQADINFISWEELNECNIQNINSFISVNENLFPFTLKVANLYKDDREEMARSLLEIHNITMKEALDFVGYNVGIIQSAITNENGDPISYKFKEKVNENFKLIDISGNIHKYKVESVMDLNSFTSKILLAGFLIFEDNPIPWYAEEEDTMKIIFLSNCVFSTEESVLYVKPGTKISCDNFFKICGIKIKGLIEVTEKGIKVYSK